MYCWKCGEAFEAKEKIQRKDTCPKCDSDLRCCYNCEFYDKAAYHQCKEPEAEWVRYKERGNFCDFFRPRSAFFRKGPGMEENAEDKKKKWNSLFRDDSEKT